MTQNKIIKMMALFTLAIVSMLSFASAIGISLAYYEDRPLLLAPGESMNVLINLQNMVGGEDITVALKVVEGNEIASTSSSTYTLKKNTADTFANVMVAIPNNAQVGKQYNVALTISTVNKNTASQMISVGTAIETSFPVNVVAPKAQPAPVADTTMMWAISVIVILIVFWIVFRMMNKKKRK